MPWYYRRPYRWRRRRLYRTRRFRYPFRRRFWRRRYRVRRRFKRKLSKIAVKQWQPSKIHKSTVKGLYCLFHATNQRLTNNWIQYMETIAPPHWPGGGGFSIMQFSILALFEQFLKSQNWWTKSNCNLPLVRYNGLTLKFYRAESYDYLVIVERCLPFEATDLMYTSCHPSIMMMTKGVIFVPCRKNTFYKKPYKKVNIKPPSQMLTKWHFQKDLAKFPLVVIRSCAASFDRIYTGSTATNTTIGFTSLNLYSFQNHNWNTPPTSGYQPQDTQWLFGIKTLTTTTDPLQYPITSLVYLGGTKTKSLGTEISSHNIDTYFSTPNLWGNIFCPEYLKGPNPVLITTTNPNTLKTKLKELLSQSSKKIQDANAFTVKTTPNLINCRYNPFNDKGVGNMIFLLSNRDNHRWEVPDDPKTTRQNLPLWLLPFGFLDWQKKQKFVSSIDVSYLTVIVCPTIDPPNSKHIYLPLDDTFLAGTSPYTNELFDNDRDYWYPKTRFQVNAINTIGTCGPGIIKLPRQQSCEAHFEYMFRFKFGGCPPPMETICNPTEEAKYPVPDSKYETTSLQNPETPIHTYLYNFDERRGLLTQKASKRIKKDSDTETTTFPFTGPSTDLPAPQQEMEVSEESTSEEEEENLHLQLRHLRRKQKLLRRRILQLLDTQNLE
nr:MAG: ORF1 [TTV-like mini virus]